MPRLLATLATSALVAVLATAAHAADKGADKAVADKKSAAAAPAAKPAADKPQPATAEQRIEAQRLPGVARAAFWAREIDVNPRDAVAGANLANALRAIGKVEEAQAAADAVLIAYPNDLDALLEAVRARLAQNQGFYAIDLAKRAQAVAPKDWRPVSLLAVAYEQSQRDMEAMAMHQAAVALAPQAATPLTNLAMFQAGHGDLAGAETLLRKASALPDATMQTRLNLALVLGLQGRLAEAETLSRRDLPPDVASNNLAWLREATAKPPAVRTYDSMRSAGS